MFTCDICDKEFSSYRGLNGHKRMHGKSGGDLISRRVDVSKIDNCCDYCSAHILKKRIKNNRRGTIENRFCNNTCHALWKWNNETVPMILEGKGTDAAVKRYLEQERGYFCEECGLGNKWNGKTLVLQMDHIDGNSDNNSLDNVRLLCPNCHTQTPTFGNAGKGNRYKKKTKRNLYLQQYKS